MDLFVLFTGNPAWAAALPGGPVTNTQDLVSISTLMAERYDCDGVDDAPGSPCVHCWSFYAEPDNGRLEYADRGWGYWGHDGAGYAAMLRAISPAIHAANPRAKVLIGGVAYDNFEPHGPFVRSFLADTLRALNAYPGGAKAYIDAVAFHYYPISAEWTTIREKGLQIQGIMTEYGVGELPMVCPEGGYWSSPLLGSSQQIQAQRLVQMYARSMSLGIGPLSWYKVYDSTAPGEYPDRGCGLFDAYGNPKDAYYAYKAMAHELGHAYYVRSFQASGVEGYVFQVTSNREMTVLWATLPAANVSFPYSCVRKVYLMGGDQEIADGSSFDLDGTVNAQVAVQVLQNKPVYVEPCH
jgi:hypothetical protein